MNCLVIGGTTDGIGKTFVEYAKSMAGQNVFVPEPFDELDIRSPISIASYFKVQGKQFDHVLYAAGTKHLNYIKDIDMQDLKRTFEVNVFGFIYLLRALMDIQEYGRICVVTSDAAYTPMRGSMDYCSSKAALHMAIKVAARELAPDWFIAGVCPSVVSNTDMTRNDVLKISAMTGKNTWEVESDLTDSNPMQTMIERDEVAAVASWLLYVAPETMTGSIVEIRGGK